MARRRVATLTRGPRPQFPGAIHEVDNMERAVINRTVETPFNEQDLWDWLLPPETRAVLRDALPLTQADNRKAWDVRVVLGTAAVVHLQFTRPDLHGTLMPKDQIIHLAQTNDTAKAPHIIDAMQRTIAVMTEFDVVRRVVDWFNTKLVTPGCARQYFPALGSLLPSDHAFHKTDGLRFKDTYFPPDIAADIRKAPEVVAKGLLSDPKDHAMKEGTMLVEFSYEGQEIDGYDRGRAAVPWIMRKK